MVTHGPIPPGVPFRLSWAALPVRLGVTVVTSTVAALLSSPRFSLLRPARALSEAAAGRRHLGPLRAPLGLVAVAGACFLSALLSRQGAEEAGQGAFLVLILFCMGVGLVGPRIVGPAAWLVSVLVGRFGASARLAMLNVRSQPRRFSAAVVPLVLVVGFGLTKVAPHTTAQHRTGSAGSTGEVWLDYMGTALYAGFAATAAANTLAMISFERRRDVALLRVVGTQRGQVHFHGRLGGRRRRRYGAAARRPDRARHARTDPRHGVRLAAAVRPVDPRRRDGRGHTPADAARDRCPGGVGDAPPRDDRRTDVITYGMSYWGFPRQPETGSANLATSRSVNEA
ncbi:hypothetical protein ACFVY1_34045 [Streptomyces sp. NPDC058293]|uniref:hypothetical protein n=1 Tax=Streptomyces sp. NPDC058293 TaxID=3346429 RepID=UPI0036F182B8